MLDTSLIFPEHKASLSLEHNRHKNVYESVTEWIEDNEWCDWENEEQKEIAIRTDEVWTLQWYPETPIGFYAVAAPTLHDLLRIANSNV